MEHAVIVCEEKVYGLFFKKRPSFFKGGLSSKLFLYSYCGEPLSKSSAIFTRSSLLSGLSWLSDML